MTTLQACLRLGASTPPGITTSPHVWLRWWLMYLARRDREAQAEVVRLAIADKCYR